MKTRGEQKLQILILISLILTFLTGPAFAGNPNGTENSAPVMGI